MAGSRAKRQVKQQESAKETQEEPPNWESPEERQRIAKLFTSLDSDNSGYLEIAELESYASSGASGLGASKKWAEELLQESDEDNDGRVSFQEFFKFVVKKEKELYKTFKEADSDNSGQLSPGEVAKVLELNGIEFKQSELDKLIAKVSTDGDDEISWQEFREAFVMNPNAVDFVQAFRQLKQITPVAPGFNILVLPIDDMKKAEELQTKIIAASVISSATARILCAPLDRIKTFFQLMPTSDHRPSSFIANLRASFTKIATDNGLISGMFRGTGLNILKLVPETAVRVAALGGSRVMVARFENADDGITVSRPGLLFSNALAACASVLVSQPFDTIRTQQMAGLEMDTPKRGSKGKLVKKVIPKLNTALFHTTTQTFARISTKMRSGARARTSHLYKTSGFRGFFSGLTPSLLAVVPYTAISESVYEWCEDVVLEAETPYKPPRMSIVLGMGLIGATAAEFLTYPLSTLRTRMMSQGTPSNPETYTSTMDCLRKTVKSSGLRGLYGGIGAAILKGVPSVTVAYWSFEVAKRKLGANWNPELGIWQDSEVVLEDD